MTVRNAPDLRLHAGGITEWTRCPQCGRSPRSGGATCSRAPPVRSSTSASSVSRGTPSSFRPPCSTRQRTARAPHPMCITQASGASPRAVNSCRRSTHTSAVRPGTDCPDRRDRAALRPARIPSTLLSLAEQTWEGLYVTSGCCGGCRRLGCTGRSAPRGRCAAALLFLAGCDAWRGTSLSVGVSLPSAPP